MRPCVFECYILRHNISRNQAWVIWRLLLMAISSRGRPTTMTRYHGAVQLTSYAWFNNRLHAWTFSWSSSAAATENNYRYKSREQLTFPARSRILIDARRPLSSLSDAAEGDTRHSNTIGPDLGYASLSYVWAVCDSAALLWEWCFCCIILPIVVKI